MFDGPSSEELAADERLGFLQLDDVARARLRAARPVIEQALPEIADAFYGYLQQWPAMARLLGDAANVDRLKAAQRQHWAVLFNADFDGSYFARAAAVGLAHERIGLAPRWYIGAYGFILERLVGALLARSRSIKDLPATIGTVVKAALLDMDLAIAAYIRTSESVRLKEGMLALTEVLEREVENSVGQVCTQAERMSDGASQLTMCAEHLQDAAKTVGASVETTLGNVQAVAGATEELDVSCQSIVERAKETAKLTAAAVNQADAAGDTIRTLTEATARINGFVAMVQTIAQQTRILALNATIEAARAGEAGKGFAVVAAEVKNLASQTEEAIRSISEQAAHIGAATERTVALVQKISDEIRGINAVTDDVHHAAEQQRQATAEISESAGSAADQTRVVTEQAGLVTSEADTTGKTAAAVQRLANMVVVNNRELQRCLTIILRSSAAGNRRKHERYPVALRAAVSFAGRRVEGGTVDLSEGGALVSGRIEKVHPGDRGEAELDQLGRFSVRLAAISALGMHLQFLDLTAEQCVALGRFMRASREADQVYCKTATEVGARIKEAIEASLASGRITLAAVFDDDYQPVPDTDPQQFLTGFTELTDALVPPIIEPVLAKDAKVMFCAPVDRNGYLPTHNRKYGQPQRPGERDWNLVNCRNRRIFDDRTGILAARNREPVLIQSYARDMGRQGTVLLKEFDAPIFLQDRLWGNVRLAVKM